MTQFIRGRIKGSGAGDQGTDQPVLVDSNGQLYIAVDPANPITATLGALSSWQTSQWDLTGSVVQIVTSPLANRKTVSLKAVCFVDGTGTSDVIYIGPSNGLTNANGYDLKNGETIDLDLQSTANIYAFTNNVRSPQNMLVCVEIA